MRKILNYLLGEDAVTEQNDREIWETMLGIMMAWVILALGFGAMYIVG